MKHVKLIYSNSFCIILFTSWKPNLSVSDQVPIIMVFKQKLTQIPGVVYLQDNQVQISRVFL